MVHEFQHSKLWAPWRTDPRPLGGLLQGVYAFLGVADTWRALAARPALGDLAMREFAEAREQVDVAARRADRRRRADPGRRGVRRRAAYRG